MLKVFVILVCLSVVFGVGYSASNPSTTVQSTTSANKTSTTAKPTTSANKTSTTAKPTTTGKPTTTPPPPPPLYGEFNLKNNKTGNYCLLAQFAATFTIQYMANVTGKNSTTLQKNIAIIYLNRTNSDEVNITGKCGSKESELSLSWPKNHSSYTLKMEFGKVAKALEASDNSTSWKVTRISLNVTLEGNKDFPNATEEYIRSSYSGSKVPSGDVGGYYSCNAKTDLKFQTEQNNTTVDVGFEVFKVEPFVTKNNATFDKGGNVCYQDRPTTVPTTKPPDNSDIVPIAVGCALAGLVLIVLIAYIIGRRKSHRGYEKV